MVRIPCGEQVCEEALVSESLQSVAPQPEVQKVPRSVIYQLLRASTTTGTGNKREGLGEKAIDLLGLTFPS